MTADPILTPERIASVVDARHTSDQCPWPVVYEIAASHEALRARLGEALDDLGRSLRGYPRESDWKDAAKKVAAERDAAEARVGELEAASREIAYKEHIDGLALSAAPPEERCSYHSTDAECAAEDKRIEAEAALIEPIVECPNCHAEFRQHEADRKLAREVAASPEEPT